MESPSAYIPLDRRLAIARGETLPEKTTGGALFADISGFTPLTEALLREYGPRRGAEELTQQLNLIYDALITEVHRYGGSVLAFSGDAITCWFDQDNGARAAACGVALQATMSHIPEIKMPSGDKIPLAMKVAVAAGPIRRLQLGDPDIQYIDTLAGMTLEQMAAAEHHAAKGEIVVTASVIENVADNLEIVEIREDPETGTRFGVIEDAFADALPVLQSEMWGTVHDDALPTELVRPWVLPPVYERLQTGQGQFLAELRPAVVLFLYFSGIDYDTDEDAGQKLDHYVQWVQTILVKYEAFAFQLTIGDKGSYLYTAFGAPIAHEDDAIRAVSAALELQSVPDNVGISEIQIGLSQGLLYTGAYGGSGRRTYGVLGDEVNLAARLMQAARPGQILVSKNVQQAAGDNFIWTSFPPIKVKGKSEPIAIFSPSGTQIYRGIHLNEPRYALPMVGRQTELDLVKEKIDQVRLGHGQIVGVTGEAGMGKSRLVAEIIRAAASLRLVGYSGECQSYGTNSSYLVWESIWRAIFELDIKASLAVQIADLERLLSAVDPNLGSRLPLLGSVLNLPIPDNDLTGSFDAKLRKTSLESLLVDCLRAKAKVTPMFLILEDCHWLDPLSHELLEVIGRSIIDLPVLMIVVYRPLQLERLKEARLEQLPHFTEIHLTDFSPQEAEQLIRLKFEKFFGANTEISPTLFQRITARAQGNPFYIEELINYLQDQAFDPGDTDAMEGLDLPTSLHSLILSRIDQLTEQQKNTIKVASVIGRLFSAAWLWGMYPDLGQPDEVKRDLETLHDLELLPMDKPEPELSYIFKHIVTQEVAYESLPYATRAILHNQLGSYIEQSYGDKLDRFINLLAFHYDRGENEDKKRKYLRKAGELAQAEYANDAAIDYYQRVLPLLAQEDKIEVTRNLGDILSLLGQWEQASEHYQQAIRDAQELGDRSAQAWSEVAMGRLMWRQSQYPEALKWLERARSVFEEMGDKAGVGQVWHEEGLLAAVQGKLEEAQTIWEKSLAIRQELGDTPNIANILNNLAIVARNQSDYEKARTLNEQALELRYELSDKRAIAKSLNNLGEVLTDIGDYEIARTQLEVAVDLQREIGDRWELANALHTLANAVRDQGDYDKSPELYEESLMMLWGLGERWMLAYALEDMGALAALKDQPKRALRLVGAAAALRKETGSSRSPAEKETLEKMLQKARQTLGEFAPTFEAEGQAMSLQQAVEYAGSKAGDFELLAD